MNSPFKFPRRVRIHGGECGAVARALHHEAQKNALIPYEWSLLSQAGLGNVLGSTSNERKQMSTKTTLKRIALVAVSAMGFGLLSVAPSSAATARTTTVGATATESIPKPNVETATSAMRLRVVFVDICFLSLVVNETFSLTAGRELISAL